MLYGEDFQTQQVRFLKKMRLPTLEQNGYLYNYGSCRCTHNQTTANKTVNYPQAPQLIFNEYDRVWQTKA